MADNSNAFKGNSINQSLHIINLQILLVVYQFYFEKIQLFYDNLLQILFKDHLTELSWLLFELLTYKL